MIDYFYLTDIDNALVIVTINKPIYTSYLGL